MKCPNCNGVPYDEVWTCEVCNGKGIVEPLTEQEYMRSCSSDELVSILCELVDSGILQEWRIKYHCADSDEDAVRMWLKEKHHAN